MAGATDLVATDGTSCGHTAQTAVANDPVYQRDAEAILTGFQVLAPTG